MKKILLLNALFFCLAMQSFSQIIITGVKRTVTGSTDITSTGNWYEYVQFRATENITFFSGGDYVDKKFIIALARNSGSTPKGWINADATSTSYVFTITPARANFTSLNKGDYFYLTGNDPKLNGSTSLVTGDDFSTAKLVKLDPTVNGDIQGAGITNPSNASNSGFFPNTHPSGIAVFMVDKASSIDSDTRPIDAIFFGEATGTGLGANKLVDALNAGYTLPTYNNNNDAKYFNVNNADGNSLYITLGTAGGDAVKFVQFGGDYNTTLKTWNVPRSLANNIAVSTITSKAILESVVGATTLPIVLKSFTAKASNQGIQLNWSTASELNNDYFEILRKQGEDFVAISGKIKGAGTTSTLQQYQFIDTKPAAGVNYYKLAQVDLDGKINQSNVVYAYCNLVKNSIKASYNKGNLTVDFDASKVANVKLDVVDLNGKTVYSVSANTIVGSNTVTNSLNLVSGVYVVKLTVGAERSTAKFVVN
ncbi:T9SS type A sorting domain-containing protein [Pedobacter sp.]